MNQTVEHSNQANEKAASQKSDFLFWLLLGAVLFASVLAISNQSLWIDEAITAWQASLPSLRDCWQTMLKDRGSELQMPLFMVFLWIWERVVGTSEVALRMSNLPWMLLGFGAFLKATANDSKLRVGVTLATAFSPFIWFYLNEARPYIMQLGGSFLVFAALYKLCSQTPLPKYSERKWMIALSAGMLIVCASSMLGVLWIGAALLCGWTILGNRRAWSLVKTSLSIWLCTLTALALLGIYYVWTLQHGARASGVAGTNWKNLLFIAYEFLGFSGLGPGRLTLREAGMQSLVSYAPILAGYAVVLASVVFIGLRDCVELGTRKMFVASFAILVGVGLVLLMMGHFAHFRVLGRHLTPLAVVILFFLGFSLSRLWVRPGFVLRIIAILFVGLNVVSCLSLRFGARHEKDDYRNAARVALGELAEGKTVWWNADRSGAVYYRVPISEVDAPRKALLVRNLDRLPDITENPDVVIQSKPDIYDSRNVLNKFLDANDYQQRTNFPAFTIWTKPKD